MSPEQVQGKDAVPPSDIFSFGVVVYEMLAGRRPFDALTTADVMAAILTSEPPALPKDTALAELERILRQCLAKNAEERWQTASDLKTALEWVPVPKPASARASSLRRLTIHITRRHGFLAASALAAVLLVVALASRWSHPAAHPGEVTRFRVQMPAGNVVRLNLSPDGRRVAYVSGGRLYVCSFDAVVSRVVYESEGTGTPSWSPDGESIAFAGGGKLRVINANTGSATVLCDINTSVAGAWGSDSTILIGVVGDGIFRIPAAGGTLTRITSVETYRGETRHLPPHFFRAAAASCM